MKKHNLCLEEKEEQNKMYRYLDMTFVKERRY